MPEPTSVARTITADEIVAGWSEEQRQYFAWFAAKEVPDLVDDYDRALRAIEQRARDRSTKS